MASRTSLETDEGLRRASHRDMAARLTARKAEVGEPDMPRNDGTRRTASNRALLKAIEEAGGKW